MPSDSGDGRRGVGAATGWIAAHDGIGTSAVESTDIKERDRIGTQAGYVK